MAAPFMEPTTPERALRVWSSSAYAKLGRALTDMDSADRDGGLGVQCDPRITRRGSVCLLATMTPLTISIAVTVRS